MRQKKKNEDAKLEQEKQETCVKCSKLQNGRHGSFEETETQSKQTTLNTLKSVLKRSASHKKEKVAKNPEKLISKELQMVGKKNKNRVQFDETQNKYFEADYVILIHEEDYDLDDYYDEGSPYDDDDDDDGYDDGMAPPQICCSNPNCNNIITLSKYPEYGYANNGLVDFKYPRPGERERFDFTNQYYDVNYEEINRNTRKPSGLTVNRCENEKCQKCNNYFDFEVTPKPDASQDLSDQVTLSPPEGYKDGGSQCCPHHGLQFHKMANELSQKRPGIRSIEFQQAENHSEEEEDDDEDEVREEDEQYRQEMYYKNEPPAERDEEKTSVADKITSCDDSEDTENMHHEEKPEKLKQRFIVETITMTTVTERRIVREASDSNSDEAPPIQSADESKRVGILKGGKLWRNSSEKAPAKSVNYNENANSPKPNEDTSEGDEMSRSARQETEKIEEIVSTPQGNENKSSIELKPSEKCREGSKHNFEDIVSPESTELTLTFKLGQHLLVSNSLKPNSAVRQLFPGPRFLSPPPLEDGDSHDATKPAPPKQLLVTAESLRLFEEAKKSKLLENTNSEDSNQSLVTTDEEYSNNRIRRTIERNTLRRSLVKYSYEYRNRLSEKKKNENSLEERIRQLTCDIDDEEPQEEKKDETQNSVPSRCSPQGEESKEPERLPSGDVKNTRRMDASSPSNSSTSSGSSTYKKLTDLFSRKSHPPPIIEDINRNIKTETVNLQCDLVLNSENVNNTLPLNSQGHRNPPVGSKNLSSRIPPIPDAKKQLLSNLIPLTACVNPDDREKHRYIEGRDGAQPSGKDVSQYSLQDVNDGLRDFETNKVGNPPDVVAETPQNEVPNDELALFVQQDAGRIEKLKKRYSAADDKSDDDDDYGFNKRPFVKGVKSQLNVATENSQTAQQMPGPRFPNAGIKPTTTTSTTTTIHTTWPYYSKENDDQKFRSYYVVKADESVGYGPCANPVEYRGYAEIGNTNYVEYKGVGQQRLQYVNQTQQQNTYSTSNTYRCQPVRFGGYSELSNYQFRHPPHSPPPLRRFISTPQPSPVPTEDGRIKMENRTFVCRGNDNYVYSTCIEKTNRPKITMADGTTVLSSHTDGMVKTSETIFHRRSVPNIQNPCLQMKFSPVNYHQGGVPTASIRFSASCSPHPAGEESNLMTEPQYSTLPNPAAPNTVGVIRVEQGQQMIRVPVPYTTGTPVQVHLMAGRLGRCDSPQRPSSPQGIIKVPMQPYNHYLIAKGTQTPQLYSAPPQSNPAPEGFHQQDINKTVDFEKQGKAIAEELQQRQKLALSRSLSQEAHARLPPRAASPVNTVPQQERGVPEGAASVTVQDSQPPTSENVTSLPSANTIYYTMNV